MPIFNWELKDPKSCESCCCLNCGYMDWCGYFNINIKDYNERPQTCIDKLGD